MKTALLLPIFLVAISGAAFSQTKIEPYVGASYSFAGATKPGLGAEFGIKLKFFYVGFEYGLYGKPSDPSDTFRSIDPAMNDAPDAEIYYAVNGGVVLDRLLLGVTVVMSHAEFVSGSQSWVNLGPDIRYQLWRHMLLGAAYTRRRGVRLGANFVF